MQKSISNKVFPSVKRPIKPEIPSINFNPKIRHDSKVVPELAESTTSNSKSSSFIMPPQNKKRHSTLIVKDQTKDSSDSLCYEEYKKTEIIKARKIQTSGCPYWFIDCFNDVEVSRSLRHHNNFAPEIFNKSFFCGFKDWDYVKVI